MRSALAAQQAPWDGDAFSLDTKSLQQAADGIKAEKESAVTVLLYDARFAFDVSGNEVDVRHTIYRIETQAAVDGWSEVSGRWEAWHQERPEIKARVITKDGTEHWLDSKTLNDVPVHEDAPDVYSDERRYGGPLPAVAVGAIVEEFISVRDTAPLFAGGAVERRMLNWSVPTANTKVVISHPESSSLKYQLNLLPQAVVNKQLLNGIETITITNGPLPAYQDDVNHAPPDVVLYPEVEFSTAKDWSTVAREYARLSELKLRVADVQNIVWKVNRRDEARIQRIRKIVAALHKDVRYTGVEFGESKLVPQYPSETLQRRYGDCKDKAAVLVTMLRAAGIPANLALLSTGPGRDVSPNMPGIGQFDHAIVYVPAGEGEPELWVDATAELSRVGVLPWMDYGRLALVIDESTKNLKKTPELTSDQNVHRELREFALAEYGHATIVESDESIGPEEAEYRQFYLENSKKLRDQSEEYVKDAYLADSLKSLERGEPADLEKPMRVKFTCVGRRGDTDLTSAIAAIRVESLFAPLPKYFKTKPDDHPSESDDNDEDSDAKKPRAVDWWLTPFTVEWHYTIKAPAGFKLRALPVGKDEKVNVLHFTQTYTSNPEGTVVEAILKVESATRRLTPKQGEELRDAVLKARNSDPIFISFDNVGHALMAAGNIREGLAAYEDVVAKHPKEALHKVQLADALLQAGLGEEARSVAKEATVLEPKSSLAYATLADTLRNDLVGRRLKKGMDFEGAVAAYKKAIALDPKKKEYRAELAMLLEFDADGERYSSKTRLHDAVSEIKDLKKIDEDYGKRYDENALFDLWYAGDYQGLLDYAAGVEASDSKRGLTVAATTLLHGPEAGLKKAVEDTTSDDSRKKAVSTAGNVLMRVRKYKEASAMFASAANGASDDGVARLAQMLEKTRPFEDLPVDRQNPRGVVQDLFSKMLAGKLTYGEALNDVVHEESSAEDGEKEFRSAMRKLRTQLSNQGLPLVTLADIALSNMHYSVDGDDALGYKVIIESPGAAAQEMYVVKEGGRYKLVTLGISGADAESIAPLALKALEKGDLTAARKWLDRAREKVHLNEGDDPLSGAIFPHFWTKGEEGDAEKARTAALVLLRSKQLKGEHQLQLEKARQAAKSEIERARLTLVLAYAHSEQQQWAEVLPLAEELVKAYPTSLRAFETAANAYAGTRRFDDWGQLVQSRMAAHPDELAYSRSAARLATYRGDFAKAKEILKAIIDKGQATSSDLNQHAWYALYVPGAIAQDAIESAQRANDLTKSQNFAIVHTLACVDAAAGKTAQSRDLLLKAMNLAFLDEPDDSIWLGFAMIAEQYGIGDAATKMYARITKPDLDVPGSSYGLAQQRLVAMKKGGGEGRTAGK